MIKDYNTIFFDLDGTLIDSAPQVIKSLKYTFDFFKIIPTREITADLIGPTIHELIDDLLSDDVKTNFNKILNKFKHFYDNELCYESNCYIDVCNTLEFLRKKNSLILVTNKRLVPTKKILEHKNLNQYFDDYYSVNQEDRLINNKEKLLKNIIEERALFSQNCTYIGDTSGDLLASQLNNVNFIFAEWGYGVIPENEKCLRANEFSELKKIF